MTVFEGNYQVTDAKIALVASKFNETITRQLVEGAQATLKQFGITDVDVYWVPGAFEIGFAVTRLLAKKGYDGIMSLGAVIKGETDHYSMIIQQVTSALMQANLQGKVPVTFGILTCDNIEQALQRAGLKAGNEGRSTAQSLLEMISLNQMM